MHSTAFGVIDEARWHHRRRLGVVALLAVFVGLSVGVIVSGRGRGGTSPTSMPGPSNRVAAGSVFSQAPDLGVSCHSASCDSVGLAVWLRRSAVSVSASIARHRFALTRGQAQPFMPSTPSTMFVGYLTPLRLVTRAQLARGAPTHWATGTSPDPLLSLRIAYRDGRVVATQLHVPVQPGWG